MLDTLRVSDPETSAAGLLGFLQGVLLLTILDHFFDVNNLIIYISIMVGIYLINTFFVFTLRSFIKFSERWDHEPQGKKIFKRFLVFLYVVMTFVLMFTL